jgi:hypothetical protein
MDVQRPTARPRELRALRGADTHPLRQDLPATLKDNTRGAVEACAMLCMLHTKLDPGWHGNSCEGLECSPRSCREMEGADCRISCVLAVGGRHRRVGLVVRHYGMGCSSEVCGKGEVCTLPHTDLAQDAQADGTNQRSLACCNIHGCWVMDCIHCLGRVRQVEGTDGFAEQGAVD